MNQLTNNKLTKRTFSVRGMHCASCVRVLERALKKVNFQERLKHLGETIKTLEGKAKEERVKGKLRQAQTEFVAISRELKALGE